MVGRDSSARATSPDTADASGNPIFGVAAATFDNRTGQEMGGLDDSGLIEIEYGIHGFAYTGSPKPGDLMYAVDNQTIDPTKGSKGLAGVCTEIRDGRCFITMGPGNDGILTAIGVEDLDVDNLLLDALTAQYQVNVPLTAAIDAVTGIYPLVFADSENALPGIQLTNSKAVSVRWNDHAAPTAIAITVPLPQNLDDTANIVVHALVSKIGATIGDATKLTIGAFFQTVAALHDADTDRGGDSDAVVGNAATKTVTELTLAIAANVVPPSPCALTLTIKPKAGTLGTDDFCVHAVWLEMTRKLLAS
jgi:hypothetical protein